MKQAVFSISAMQDKALHQLQPCKGFGLISGVRIGRIYILDRLHFLQQSYDDALIAYHGMKTPTHRDYIGLFSLGVDERPVIKHSGLFMMVHENRIDLFSCRWCNGGNNLNVETIGVENENV